MLQVSLKGVSSCSKGVSRVFERSLKGVSGKFQWCFKSVSSKFQECLKGVLSIHKSVTGILPNNPTILPPSLVFMCMYVCMYVCMYGY